MHLGGDCDSPKRPGKIDRLSLPLSLPCSMSPVSFRTELVTHLVAQLLQLPSEEWTPQLPGSASRACIQNSHSTITNEKEVLNGLKSALHSYPPSSSTDRPMEMPISLEGLTTNFQLLPEGPAFNQAASVC